MKTDDKSWWALAAEDEQAFAALRADGLRLSRLDRLARAALSAAPVDLSCAECRDRMPDLASAAMADRFPDETAPPRRLAAAADHVLRCAYCAEELGALVADLGAAAAEGLPSAAGLSLDLGFLDEPAATWLALPERLRRLSGEIRIAVGERAARFLPSPGLPPAQAAALGPLRGEAGHGDAPSAGEVLLLPDGAADLTIRLSVGPAVAGRAAVALTVGQLDDGGPLPDTRIVLYDGQEQLLASAKTASDGSALFRDLVAGRYLVEVRWGAGRWRLPLVVTAATG